MRIAVVTPMMATGERGGAEALYEGLIGALRQTEHEVERVVVQIDESSFDAVLRSYQRCYELDLDDFDLVVSTKAPTYMVRHRNHVVYLLHTLRVFYDMFSHEYGRGTREQIEQRALIHHLDRLGLHPDRVRAHFANGNETFMRLRQTDPFWDQVRFQALHHPAPFTGYRESQGNDYVFLPGRLHRWKRAGLAIEAIRRLRSDVHLKIAGTGEDEAVLRQLAGGDPRIEFLGAVNDDEMLNLYAGALVVPFVPRNEDYGLITIEAFSSGKPVITCSDSGEPVQFVRDYVNGFVVPPTAQRIANKIEFLHEHPDHAAAMGRRGRQTVRHINWTRVTSAILAAGTANYIPRRSKSPAPVAAQASHRTVSAFQPETPALRGGAPASAEAKQDYRVTVLDMQPIEPAAGGGRLRLLGLYHALGENFTTKYVGTFDWPGPGARRLKLSDTLEEVDIPLSEKHFTAAQELAERCGSNVIDVSFDLLARHSPEYVAAARQAAQEADIVVFSHPWIYPLVRDVLEPARQLIVYDSHNVEAYLRAQILDQTRPARELVDHVAQIEHDLCQAADLILACSQEDRQLFVRLFSTPIEKIAVVPNGAFSSRIERPTLQRKLELRRRLGLANSPSAIFVGSPYGPNEEAARFIIEELAPRLPDVKLLICGGVGEAPSIAQHIHSRRENVLITGRVSEEEKLAYLQAADLAINPMFSGSGTNVKMFDFLSAGLPTVSTAIGARGIVQAGEQSIVIADRETFARTARAVLADPASAGHLGKAGRHLVEQHYAWERISPDLGRLLAGRHRQLGQAQPFFSVVIPTYERHDLLDNLVSCIKDQEERSFEVIIVDQSAEPWPNRDRCQELDLLYLHTDVVGAISARNTGAFYARGEVIAFTDDDCRPLPDWLRQARGHFGDDDVVGVEGLIVSDKLNSDEYREVTNQGFEGLGFMTANLFIRRKTFLEIGGFDLRFDRPHFREDTDLGWRALDLGRIPFGHDVRVYHPAHKRDSAREGLVERNRFFEKDPLLLAKHPERYEELFRREGHYRHTPGFWENFLRGAEKYGVDVPEKYLGLRDAS